MDILLFVAVSIALYILAGWLLRLIEKRVGQPLKHRSIYFFAILLASALIAFNLLRAVLDS